MRFTVHIRIDGGAILEEKADEGLGGYISCVTAMCNTLHSLLYGTTKRHLELMETYIHVLMHAGISFFLLLFLFCTPF